MMVMTNEKKKDWKSWVARIKNVSIFGTEFVL
jgi:hypothetical protein